jgi:hypothetical protein
MDSSSPKTPCLNCGKLNQSANYCDWECSVAHAKSQGGKEILPNGLPVRCILADGTMLECEHGDHPDYKFPVMVLPGGLPQEDIDMGMGGPEMHALLYTDGNVALTLHEAVYWMWDLRNGSLVAGPSWAKEYRLTPGAVEMIKEAA